MGDLSEHFDRSEFACKCGCGFDTVNPHLIELLELIREDFGSPLVITSGCRCPAHNEESGGVENSPHIRGVAADILARGGILRYEIVQSAFNYGAYGIGVGKTFIHVDIDDDPGHPRPAVWSY